MFKHFSHILFFLFLFAFRTGISGNDLPQDTSRPAAVNVDKELEKKIFSDEAYLQQVKNGAPVESEGFLTWLLRKLFGNLTEETISNIWLAIKIAAIILFVGGIILILIKNDFVRIFRGNSTKIPIFNDLSDDIENMDIDAVINDAVRAGDYKTAFRYTFLKALQIMNQKNLIEWQPHKTNLEYYLECKESNEKALFKDLYLAFEQVWYGDAHLNKDTFEKYRAEFITLSNKISA